MTTETPMDGDDLIALSARIDALPPQDAQWVEELMQECLRARMSEAELLAQHGSSENSSSPRSNSVDMELAQVVMDAAEWLKTLWNVGYMGAGHFPAAPRSDFPQIELEDVLQSSLFARIREGKRPLPFPPPTRNGLPWHDLVEGPNVPHDVNAEIIRDTDGTEISTIIEGESNWAIIEAHREMDEYVIQHNRKGPLYRLCIDTPFSVLYREEPRWTRRIYTKDRGGIRSYLLEWKKTDGASREIPLRAATWERAESEANHWIAANHPEMYGQVNFERIGEN